MELMMSTQCVHECEDVPGEGDEMILTDVVHQVWIYGPGANYPSEVDGYLGVVKVTYRATREKSFHCFQAPSHEELLVKMSAAPMRLLNFTLEHASEDCWCH